jgi:large subunit ribosomal protein L5
MMATKEGGSGGKAAGGGGAVEKARPQAEKKPGKSKGAGRRAGRELADVLPTEPHAGAGKPVPPPRLRDHFNKMVKPKLMAQFGFRNPHQVPALRKIVINVGVGEAIKQPKALDRVVDELAVITGQRPIRKRAKKSIANFGLREGQEIGAAVTLRGARMWEFLDRFISVAIPRIRDFRGLATRSFDGRGNYSLGLKEQLIFPEINYDMVESVHGMDVTFVTTAGRDDQALALLRELGMPFRDPAAAAGGTTGGVGGGR